MTDLTTLADRIEAGTVEMEAYDRTGRPIRVGDVLKVFHFTGARWRKRYYMYKQVIGEAPLGKSGNLYLQVSHLNMKPFSDPDGGHWLAKDGKRLPDIEIVQGIDWHHDRPRDNSIGLAARHNLEQKEASKDGCS